MLAKDIDNLYFYSSEDFSSDSFQTKNLHKRIDYVLNNHKPQKIVWCDKSARNTELLDWVKIKRYKSRLSGDFSLENINSSLLPGKSYLIIITKELSSLEKEYCNAFLNRGNSLRVIKI